MRIEPPPSFPWATGTRPAATAAHAPPDDPPVESAGSQGLRVGPKASGCVVDWRPNSGVLDLPTVTRPISRKRAPTGVSSRARWPASRSARLPAKYGSPACRAPRSFSRNGTPARGPEALSARSRASAKRRTTTAFRWGSMRSMRSIAASTSSRRERSPLATASACATASMRASSSKAGLLRRGPHPTAPGPGPGDLRHPLAMARRLALWITCATGFSGLVYEVTWQKYLATLLGSHSEATAAVIGLFLGGLAIGYARFGALTRGLLDRSQRSGRPARLLAVYGGIEAAIGLYAFAFPWLFELARAVSPHLPGSSGGLGFAGDVVLSALLIGPPAVLMGATIPFLTQALARDLADSTRIHALVYASNTAGAFAGALAAGFWLVPVLGLVGVLFAMGAVNLAAGAAFAGLDARARREGLGATAEAAPAPLAVRVPGLAAPLAGARTSLGFASLRGRFAAWLAIALLVGFAMATLQTVFIRLGALAFGASQFTFSMVVAVFVLCIALGAFAVSALPRIPSGLLAGSLWALVALLSALYLPLGDATYWSHVLRSLFGSDPASFHPYHLAAFAALLVVVGPAVVLSGATLPLVFHQLRREVGELGALAGRLYSANTIGSFLGALVGGYALFVWLDLHSVYRVAVAALALAAAVASACLLPRLRLPAVALTAASLALLALLPPWRPDRLSAGLFRTRDAQPDTYAGPDAFFAARRTSEILSYDDDPTASITVREVRMPNGDLNRSIRTNGKSDGSVVGDYVTMGLAGLLPALFADDPSRAFVIGWGTGVTAGELAALDSVHEVVVAEISPAVLRARPFFDYGNHAASISREIRAIRSDAYRALQRAPGRFGVIASEPSNPWVVGVEML